MHYYRRGNNKIIYKKLSYEIVGILFEIFNEIGYGYNEKHYEKATAKMMEFKKIKFKTQVPINLIFKTEIIGRRYLDFLIENKIILELKRGNYFSKRNIHQVNEYLRATGLKLAILANFTSRGVKFARIINIK